MNDAAARPAFTLPEVLIALLLFAVGILGFAATATAIATQTAASNELLEGTALAGSVLDSLRASSCHSVASGTATRRRAVLSWRVTPARETVAVTAVLTIPTRQGPRRHTFDALLPCESP